MWKKNLHTNLQKTSKALKKTDRIMWSTALRTRCTLEGRRLPIQFLRCISKHFCHFSSFFLSYKQVSCFSQFHDECATPLSGVFVLMKALLVSMSFRVHQYNVKEQKSPKRTCGYWIVNNQCSAKKKLQSFGFIAKYFFNVWLLKIYICFLRRCAQH